MAHLEDIRQFNLKMSELLKKTSKTYKIDAIDTYADGPNASKIADKKYLFNKEEKCGGLIESLDIAIGTWIMLRRNMDTSKGIIKFLNKTNLYLI